MSNTNTLYRSANETPEQSIFNSPPPPYYSAPFYAYSNNLYHRYSGFYSLDRTIDQLKHDYTDRSKLLHTLKRKDETEDLQIMFPKESSDLNSRANISEMFLNESLERIGDSLQQLIDKAQISLQTDFNGNPKRQTSHLPMNDDVSDQEQPYAQIRYHQSQEKLSQAFQQLDDSIESISGTLNTEKMQKESTCKGMDDTPQDNNRKRKYGLLSVMGVMSLCTMYPYYRCRYNYIMIMLFLWLFRRIKKCHKEPVMNMMDRLVMRQTLKNKATPSLVRFLHCSNVGFQLLRMMTWKNKP